MDRIYGEVTMLAMSNPGTTVIRLRSVEASRLFADGGVDFAYIDGLHDYGSVCSDLRAWHPKMKKGGVLAGHDLYMDDVRRLTSSRLQMDTNING
jgi:hypothetical protein